MAGVARSRHDRTRSPRGGFHRDLNGFISRAVAGFGRYEHNRPRGLLFNEDGDMLLDSLMQCWGQDEGLTKEDVLDALNASMFSDASKTVRRFDIIGDPSADVSIRVYGSHKHQRRDTSRPHRPEREVRRRPPETPPERSEQDPQRGEPRDDVLMGAERPAEEATQLARPVENLPRGPEEANGHDRRDRFRLDRYDRHDRHDRRMSSRNNRSTGEEVQRWLGWVLKRGYREMGLKLKGGEWINIESVAQEIRFAKRRLGIQSAEELQDVLRDTDEAGRFEMLDGYLRKVPREDRGASTGASSGNAAGSRATPAERTDRVAPADRQDMQTDEPVSPQDRGSRSQIRANHGEVLPAEVAEGDDAAVQERLEDRPGEPPPVERPSRPPGEHWKKFVDNGEYWWFYQGPLGRWWYDSLMTEPEPYED